MAVQLGARLVAVCDAVASAIVSGWEPAGNDEVTRDWVSEEDLKVLTGRKVFVLPAGARTVQRLTRDRLLNEYSVSVRVIERFEEAGRPTAEWVDERVEFLDTILTALDLTAPAVLLLGTLWTETIEITNAADPDAMLSMKLLWSEVEVAFRENAAG